MSLLNATLLPLHQPVAELITYYCHTPWWEIKHTTQELTNTQSLIIIQRRTVRKSRKTGKSTKCILKQ